MAAFKHRVWKPELASFAESMPEEYVQAILNADATGQKLHEDYVSERIN